MAERLFADGVTTADQIAAMYNGIYAPSYATPSPSTPVGAQPSWADIAAMFGGAAPANPVGYQSGFVKSDNDRLVSPALNYAGTPVAADVPVSPVPGMPRPRPIQPPQTVASYPTTAAAAVAAMAAGRPVAASPRKTTVAPARAPAPQQPTKSAASQIADMFAPVGTIAEGTNGYTYAADGQGGFIQVGNRRPPGMTPAQQYAAASASRRNPQNAAERMASNSSRGNSGSDSIFG